MKLYIDDIRPLPAGFDVKISRVDEAIDFIKQHIEEISVISLDHDAGDYFKYGGDYIKILDWLEEYEYTVGQPIKIAFMIHSGNPVGVKKMYSIITHHGWKYELCDDELIYDVLI